MAVTPAQVGVEIGIPTPTSEQTAQWQSWIDQAYYLIERRYGVGYTSPTSADADYVVLMVVSEHAKHPDGSTRVAVAVDDASVSKEYSTSAGRVTLDDWWDFLDDTDATSGAFTISPTGSADTCWTDTQNWRVAPAWYDELIN